MYWLFALANLAAMYFRGAWLFSWWIVVLIWFAEFAIYVFINRCGETVLRMQERRDKKVCS